MSILLLLTPVWRWLGIFGLTVLVAGSLLAFGHHRGYALAEAKYVAAAAAEETRQAAVRAKALDEAVARELARAAENDQLEQKVESYEKALARKPDGCFRLRADDVGELRKLQGRAAP